MKHFMGKVAYAMRIAVDAFGGDYAPLEMIKGAALAAREYGHAILLVGDEAVIRQTAADHAISLEGMELVHAPGVFPMDGDPRSILKDYKDCSMAKALQLVSEGQADACVSAGSTGALIMGGTFLVKRIKGVSRAALAPLLPSDNGPFMLIDSGANVECRPEMLLQFAQMGHAYMSRMFDGEATVGLVNVGTEDTKGGQLQLEAFDLLKNSGLPFIGNIEARQIPYGVAKVVVADGFTGNVVLKMMEGTADVIMSHIKGIFLSTPLTRLAALMVKPHLAGFKKKMTTEEYGGAPLLGLSRPVIKAHGNSKAYAFKNAIRVAAEFAGAGVIEEIGRMVARSGGKETSA